MKSYIWGILFILLGLIFWLAYNIIGSEVLADGTLKEPFGLIPLRHLSFFIGFIILLISGIKNLVTKKSK